MNHGREAIVHCSEKFGSLIEKQSFPKDLKNI